MQRVRPQLRWLLLRSRQVECGKATVYAGSGLLIDINIGAVCACCAMVLRINLFEIIDAKAL